MSFKYCDENLLTFCISKVLPFEDHVQLGDGLETISYSLVMNNGGVVLVDRVVRGEFIVVEINGCCGIFGLDWIGSLNG